MATRAAATMVMMALGNGSLVWPEEPTQLVRDLHDYPRLDNHLRSVNSTLPAFTGEDEDHQYLQSALMAATFPVALLLAYFVLEVLVRVVVAFGGCCERKPQRPAGRPAERLHKTRCWWATLVVLLLLALTAVVYGVHHGRRAGEAVSSIASSGHTTVERLDAVEELSTEGLTDARAGVRTASSLLERSPPPGVYEALQEIRDASALAVTHLDDLADQLDTLGGFRRYVRDFEKHSDHVYGPFGGMTWVVFGSTAVVLAYAMTQAGVSVRRRSKCATFWLVIFDFFSMVVILALAAFAFIQLSGSLIASDACVEPVPATSRILAAHMAGDELAASQHYLFCDAAHPNPLNASLASASAGLARARAEVGGVVEWASSTGNASTEALARALQSNLDAQQPRLASVESGLACDRFHNPFFEAVNEVCRPLVDHIFNLMLMMATTALCLVLVRAAAVYRCCRCCYRTDAEDEGPSAWLLQRPGADGEGGRTPPSATPRGYPSAPPAAYGTSNDVEAAPISGGATRYH